MKFKIGEKGFTLVEVLATLAILSAIMTVMTAAVILIQKTSVQNNEWNVNLRQVQNAGHWISRDAMMAQVVSDNTTGVFLSLKWADWNGASSNVEYFFDGDTLMRRVVGGSEFLVAQYIILDATTCEWDEEENSLIVTIRASLNGGTGRYVERTYEITPRPVAKGG